MKIITFGEIMLRLTPPSYQTFLQTDKLEMTFGGGEANVAASLANWGETAQFITSLPDNSIGEGCKRFLLKNLINIDHISTKPGRIGIYFVEQGAAQRSSKVIYDRAESAFAKAEKDSFNWMDIFDQADWFHWTGITPAVSEMAYNRTREAVIAAQEKKVIVSCDMNYRKKLWKWGVLPSDVMPELVEKSDILIGNEEDAEKVFNIKAPGANVITGQLESKHYVDVVSALAKKFPNLKTISITLRKSLSATHNRWSSIMLHDNQIFFAKEYDIDFIVDRIGSGDAFAAGLIYGLNNYSDNPQLALDFATGAAVLKHSIPGDFNLVDLAEIHQLIHGDGSGRVLR